jgi:cobyric acid synthase
MKILKEIKLMYQLLPDNEKEIFKSMFGSIHEVNLHNHKNKQIIYNLLLWRTT